MKNISLLLFLTLLTLSACKTGTNTSPDPDTVPLPPVIVPTPGPGQTSYKFHTKKLCDLPVMAEKSGVCRSGDRLYFIQDSDQTSNVTVTDLSCAKKGSIKLKGISNHDFEAVACGGGNVYVGDIGDGADQKSIISFPEPADPNATIAPKVEKFSSDLNFEGLAWIQGKLIAASKAWDEPQYLWEIKDGKAIKLLELPFKEALGDLAVAPSGQKFIVAKDDSDLFWECTWEGKCNEVKTGFSGDHEAVTYLEEMKFIFLSEDDNAMYQSSWETEAPPTEQPGPVDPPTNPSAKWYVPAPMTSFQILDSDDGDWATQASKKNAQIIVVEAVPDKDEGGKAGFERIAKGIEKLHAKGKKVSCYHSLSVEPWRYDIANFPSSAKGSKMKGWDEWWSDWRVKSKAQGFWDNRYIQFQKIGCDCVEDDNEVDPADNDTGFPLTVADADQASQYRAQKAHELGMCHLAKNNPTISAVKSKHSDGVMIEEAAKYNERDDFLPWKKAGKWAAMIEYSSGGCKPYDGFNVQYHPGGDYFDGLNFKECNGAKLFEMAFAQMTQQKVPLTPFEPRKRHGRSPRKALALY